MKQYRHAQALSAEFPQPAQQQRGGDGQPHPGRALVQGMQGREDQSHPGIGQAERAPLRLASLQQGLVQTEAKDGFFSDRGDQQQGQQRHGCAGRLAQPQAELKREPGANRTAGHSGGIGSALHAAGSRVGLSHGWHMIVALVLSALPALSFAGLGQDLESIKIERMRMAAQHRVTSAAQYSLHELQGADGSRVRQYVSASGMVFAVSWRTLYKPDLSALLGPSYPVYALSAQVAAQRAGVQRHFRHADVDLVLQSSAHLHVFSGFALRRSMLPRGLDPQQMGLE